MILRTLMVICFVACVMLAASAVSAQKKADELRAIEKERLRSLVDADIATARRLHADDFQLINPNGGTLSKEQYLADIASERWITRSGSPRKFKSGYTKTLPSSATRLI